MFKISVDFSHKYLENAIILIKKIINSTEVIYLFMYDESGICKYASFTLYLKLYSIPYYNIVWQYCDLRLC